MKIVKKIAALVVCGCALAACVSEVGESAVKPVESGEVGFELCGEATRTSIDPDGVTTRWAPGDKMAVWAQDAAGNYTLENTTFRFHHYSDEFDHGYFVANIASMTEGDYTYMLAYPTPQSVSGTQATFSVPATQSGAYDGKYDIMIAEPAVAEALSAERKVEINTVMRHQMHAVKITVPEGRNLYGTRFYRLEITFPNPVVGDITLDITNPDAEPVYSNMSNVVVLESAEGFDAGSVLWAFVLPGTVDGDVSYRVRGERRHSNVATYSLSKQMQKGRVTPITMTIPTIYPYYSAAIITVEQNNLGEEYNTVRIYDANGGLFGEYPRNDNGVYIVDYEGEFDCDQYDNTSWRVEFDSEHAIVSSYVAMGDMTDYTSHNYTTDVPYLLYEDFSTIASYSRDVVTSAQGTTTTAYDLSEATYGLRSGWTGARTGGEAGTAIRVGGRVDEVVLGTTRTYGRLDSPALSGIKSGVKVNVKVSFNYSGGRDGSSKYSPWAKIGYHTTTGNIEGHKTTFSDSWSTNGVDAEVDITPIEVTSSWSSITQEATYTFNEFTNAHRLSWVVTGSGRSNSITNGNNWIYLDNIKVQIVQ